ncbi:hypothetical protein RV03_GL003475 [Enterococcus gallinarum]|nr:hypothetical protein RV03_GL003475 [Enterococcus gallinarum]
MFLRLLNLLLLEIIQKLTLSSSIHIYFPILAKKLRTLYCS